MEFMAGETQLVKSMKVGPSTSLTAASTISSGSLGFSVKVLDFPKRREAISVGNLTMQRLCHCLH